MYFRIEIEHIRPIEHLSFEVDLAAHRLICIAGKNGVGKTTLIKAFRNLMQSDTFFKTSSDGTFAEKSRIRYFIGEDTYSFEYDSVLRSISTRKLLQAEHKALLTVEMAAPHGQRFTFFKTLSEYDDEIRQAVVLERFEKPIGLIEFLSDIYLDNRFDNLVEVKFRRGTCCCFVDAKKRYIREDYFSSGEYFLINLYRKLTLQMPLVVIDEIDISLDSSAQARLAKKLRTLCAKHNKTVIFTSHSLALMQTLEPGELYLLECDVTTRKTQPTPASFNVVKALMFSFQGFDRYILTEDDLLAQFLEYVIDQYCPPSFFSYQIICFGGQGYVTGMMRRNKEYGFLGPAEFVIGIKDGDQAHLKQDQGINCIPLQSVEKALWDLYRKDHFGHKFQGGEGLDSKALFREFRRSSILSTEEIFQLLCIEHDAAIVEFAKTLSKFLCRPNV